MAKVESVSITPRTTAPEILEGLAAQERARQKALRRLAKLRQKAFDEIERLVAFIDASDEYASTELEEDDDRESVGDEEPSLGSFDRMVNQEKSWRQSLVEIPGTDAELDTADDEPSLGALEVHPTVTRYMWSEQLRDITGSQTRWATGGSDDREDEHDGAEPDVDDEPSLGWTTSGALGGLNDREQDDAESGIGDHEGLLEQEGMRDWTCTLMA